ncbi:ribosome biogenesis GTPase YlqF [Ruminococcaceae bacterium OttesenSCG-928-A16]|nr:ribosome biogenesis GTPase YlqF [Ruminococcaceae bacterium OttesenSCG-928-A16]
MSEDLVLPRNIHWFPGHMMRTLRSIEKNLPKVDAVVQLLDARIPRSSLNPDLQRSYTHKTRLYVLNKADLADEAVTADWLRYFRTEEAGCVAINSKQKGAAAQVKRAVETALAELLERRQQKGMVGAQTRLMITGIPNVGKSTFINNWAGTNKAKAADKPGVTRGEQWITTGDFELMDMPGVLWKKFDDMETAVNLALIGSIPDRLLNTEEIAAGLLAQLANGYAPRLCQRFKLQGPLPQDGWELLEAVGKRRGMLISGGEIDLERASIMVLDEFRGGLFGRISLEKPDR